LPIDRPSPEANYQILSKRPQKVRESAKENTLGDTDLDTRAARHPCHLRKASYAAHATKTGYVGKGKTGYVGKGQRKSDIDATKAATKPKHRKPNREAEIDCGCYA
jgi:hypothetical protein